jgi:hypothetical protein
MITAPRNDIGISFHTVFLTTVTGVIIAVIPKINNILAIFDPTTLPKATPVFPDNALVIDTTSSGDEVPKATTVSPITIGEILNRNASDDAPSTNQFADLIRSNNPAINMMIFKRISIVN